MRVVKTRRVRVRGQEAFHYKDFAHHAVVMGSILQCRCRFCPFLQLPISAFRSSVYCFAPTSCSPRSAEVTSVVAIDKVCSALNPHHVAQQLPKRTFNRRSSGHTLELWAAAHFCRCWILASVG
jgi:hypothetical protein